MQLEVLHMRVFVFRFLNPDRLNFNWYLIVEHKIISVLERRRNTVKFGFFRNRRYCMWASLSFGSWILAYQFLPIFTKWHKTYIGFVRRRKTRRWLFFRIRLSESGCMVVGDTSKSSSAIVSWSATEHRGTITVQMSALYSLASLEIGGTAYESVRS